MSDRVRYQYGNLEEFARRFADHMADAERLRLRLSRQLAVLEGGGWLGEGAQRFSVEMHDRILPALERLNRVLDEMRGVMLRAVETMREAENEAAALFQSVDVTAARTVSLGQGASLNPAARAARAGQIAALTGLREDQSRFVQDLRRGMDGNSSQTTGVQQAYDRLIADAALRAQRMNTLIGALQGGAAL